MATSPGAGGHPDFDTQMRRAARKVSARQKRAVRGAKVAMTPNLTVPPSKVSASAEGVGHATDDTHLLGADPHDITGQRSLDTQRRSAGSEGGQVPHGNHTHPAPLAQVPLGHDGTDTHHEPAEGGEGHSTADTQLADALPETLAQLKSDHRMRTYYMNARKRLELQMGAICRYQSDDGRGEKTDKELKAIRVQGRALFGLVKKGKAPLDFQAAMTPMLQAFRLVHEVEKVQTKRLEAGTEGLPVHVLEWADGVQGFGRRGLGQILAETGDLSNYANPAKVWKRMGLAVFDGKSQRKWKDKKKAALNAYSPQRRSIMHMIGKPLICAKGGYYDIYIAEKERQELLYPDLPLIHRHRKALRYMQKRLLRDLWRVWREANACLTPTPLMPSSTVPVSGGAEGHEPNDTQAISADPSPESETVH